MRQKESVSIEQEINRQPLFLIHYKSKWADKKYLATQASIDYHRKYYDGTTTVLEELGIPEIDCSIKLVEVKTGRCYVEHWYEVRSKNELNDRDFDILRAWRCFLQGQITGQVSNKKFENGEWVYSVQSVCDSGD
jgi:hypothetical protein